MDGKGAKNNYIFDGKGILALFGGYVGGSILIALLYFSGMYIFDVNIQYKDIFLIISQIAVFAGMIFAFDYFICRPTTGKKLNFNFSPTNLMTYFIVFPMMLGMMFVAEFVTSQIPITGPFFGGAYEYFSKLMEKMTGDPATLILLVVILAPLFEEIIFRGIIMKGLLNKGLKPKPAIFISAIAFGLIHGNPWQFVGGVLLGSVLGLVYYKSKSLLLPILLHAFNNLIASVMLFYYKTESFADTFKVSEWLILIVGIVLFTTFYLLLSKKYRVHHIDNSAAEVI